MKVVPESFHYYLKYPANRFLVNSSDTDWDYFERSKLGFTDTAKLRWADIVNNIISGKSIYPVLTV